MCIFLAEMLLERAMRMVENQELESDDELRTNGIKLNNDAKSTLVCIVLFKQMAIPFF